MHIEQHQRIQQASMQLATEKSILQQQTRSEELNDKMLSNLKIGMIVDARDGNSLFTAKILSIDAADQTYRICWTCDDSITHRLPFSSIYLKEYEDLNERKEEL